MVDDNTVTINVYLKDEGTHVWRPIQAVHLGDDLYRIVSDCSADEFSEETWEFKTGEVVRCERKIIRGGINELVAVALAPKHR